MLETLKARKEALEAQGKKGFTLMEMLIVIAIIAVLIAIAIPIFTSQLERSREATDAANIRSAYAEVMADALVANGGSSVAPKAVTMTQAQDDWQNSFDLPENLSGRTDQPKAGGTATLTYTAPTSTTPEGTVSVSYAAKS